MTAILGFCGASGSGKTQLLTGVVRALTARGLRVGVIKHHGHGEPLPRPAEEGGKDTTRLAEAGAARVALSHAGGLRVEANDLPRTDPQALAGCLMDDLDLVLVEGFKTADLDKIEVVAPGRTPLLPPGGRLLALTRRGGGPSEAELPVLDADQPESVAAFVLEALRLAAAPQARLWLDGVELELNHFVQAFLDSTLRGMVGQLKGGENAKSGLLEVRLG